MERRYNNENVKGRDVTKVWGRGVARPGKCDVRRDKNEMRMLDELAEANEVTRSDIMRRALKDYWKFNTDKED